MARRAEARRLHEDAQVTLPTRRRVDQRLHPRRVAIRRDDDQGTTASPSLTVPANGFVERYRAAVLRQREIFEDAKTLRLAAACPKPRAAVVIRHQPDRLRPSQRRVPGAPNARLPRPANVPRAVHETLQPAEGENARPGA